jgi:endonuclease/exonuclease/phosphatase family metal-dependent hydrolase
VEEQPLRPSVDQGTPRERHSRARRLALPAIVIGLALLGLAVADLTVRERDHVFGLSRALAPYLALLFVPIALLGQLVRGRRGAILAVVATLGLGLAVLRFVPALPGGAAHVDPSLPRFAVATWNLYHEAVAEATLIEALTERAPAVIALQELSPERAAIISSSDQLRARFPYQVLRPSGEWDGLGLLSSWPIEGPVVADSEPPHIAATVAAPGTAGLDVLVTHAPPPLELGPLGPTYAPRHRDEALSELRGLLDASLADGRPVVLLGDLNLTDRELAYEELVDGLVDSYRAAGTGFGHTWRPPYTELPFGLLRIDMVLVDPSLAPVTSQPDCTSRGADHCILDVELAVRR